MPAILGNRYVLSNSFFQKNDFDNIELSQMAPESEDLTNSTCSINSSVMLNTAKALDNLFIHFPNGFIIVTIFIPVQAALSLQSSCVCIVPSKFQGLPMHREPSVEVTKPRGQTQK